MSLKKSTFDVFPEPRDRYVLEDCLGCGAFGKVFAAVDSEASNKKVAVKIQKLNENTRVFSEQEFKVLRNLNSHVNLPDFYGVYRKENELWFVMEICEGGSILDLVEGLLEQNRRMSEEHIAYILKETIKAVIFLHDKCLIHRDIKAKNILLTSSGDVKLVDFGFGASLDNSLEKTDGIVGSPCWMAPEIITCRRKREKYDNRVDVWSLGITAIELGDGKAPFQSMHPTRALFQIVTNPPPTLYRTYNWSENYIDFIDECLVKNPHNRPYATELLEHPFLAQIPANSYHMTLEMKALIDDISKLDLPKAEPEIAIIETFLKCGSGDLEPMLIEDLASLDHITEKNVLKLLESRMECGLFQTFVGDVLLVLNPFEKKDIFGDTYHEKYRLKSRSDNAPHIYAVADSAYQYALHHQIPQKILLSGESGSGKTRNYLHLVNHLFFLGQNDNINLERIRGGIKLIHSLTHASTPINNYSTRCVFKTDIKYGSTGKVSGAIFNVYQLEKWRVSSVDMFQGNYHFLYYIYDGLRENKKLEQYQLNPDRQYRYLRVDEDSTNNNPKFNVNKNLNKFKKLLQIFEDFELGYDEMDTIFSVVATILVTGEIRFQESEPEGAVIENVDTIEKIGLLLKIDHKKFEWALTNYCLVRKGTAVRKRSTVDEARDARDVFANNLYTRLVDYLVDLVNNKLTTGRAIFGEKYSVQIFDYFGFECVKTNHLSQLFVNCFNEQLHYHYLQRLFSWEYLDIKEEELEYQPFGYYDNKKTLDQLLGKPEGLFSVIDEASKTGRDANYITNCFQGSEKEFVGVVGTDFSISHYTGKVTYCATEMSIKNRDFLPPEVTETLRLSNNSTIKTLFTNKLNKNGNLIAFETDDITKTRRYKFQSEKTAINQYSQIRRMRTCIQTFKAFSLEMFKQLSIGSGCGGTHFVRCIRTNLTNEPQNFDYQLIKQQIRALAITETAKARQWGYSHRIPFQEFLRRYKFLAFDFNETVDVNRENCRLLLIRLKLEGWNIGKSKVFLKYYNEEYLARSYETQVKKIIKIQSILRRFLAKCLMAKQITNREKSYITTIGRNETRRMTEEEAAAIIQKAYRESTVRKSYPDFAKDYKILDEETCEFIRSYANKWRRNSVFHVLVLYRALTFQEMFNFTQQVHLYNIGVFYELQKNNTKVPLEDIDFESPINNWLEEPKLPLRKIPFHLDEIPFYDTSGMCNLLTNSGVCIEKEERWDSPYRWRGLVSSKTIQPVEDMTRSEETLIEVPFIRDPVTPLDEVPDVADEDTTHVKILIEEFISKEDKDEENQVLKKISEETINVLEKKLLEESNKRDSIASMINSDTQLANKDFDYIKPPVLNKPKPADPVAELRKIGQKNVSEDDPPYNFQGMLRKTNFKKEPIKENESLPIVPVYSLKKRRENTDDEKEKEEEDAKNKKNKKVERNVETMNGMIEDFERTQLVKNRVTFEIAPGIIIEGIEVEV